MDEWIAIAPEDQRQLWAKLDLRAALEAATGLPTTWFNDGNCACFAEMVMSPPPRSPNLVHLFVSTYLGAGITAEHKLWEGPTGNSANLGSMLVNCHDGGRAHRRLELAREGGQQGIGDADIGPDREARDAQQHKRNAGPRSGTGDLTVRLDRAGVHGVPVAWPFRDRGARHAWRTREPC